MDILRADNVFFEWLSLCQGGLNFFLNCLKCFRRVAIFSGEGCRELPEVSAEKFSRWLIGGGGRVGVGFQGLRFFQEGVQGFLNGVKFFGSGGVGIIICSGIDIVSRERVSYFFMVVETFSVGVFFSCGLIFFGGGGLMFFSGGLSFLSL